MLRQSVLLLTLSFIINIQAKKLADIYWNSTNPMLEEFAEIGDRVDIKCPFFKSGDIDTEQSIIYRVSEDDFLNCRLGADSQEVGRCTTPYQTNTLNLAFRSFSPNPYALEYKPDRTYFFISTSDGSPEGLNLRIGGLCQTKQLKMMVHISQRNGHHHRYHHKKVVTTTIAPLTTTTTEEPAFQQDNSVEEPSLYKKDDATYWGHFYDKMSEEKLMWPQRELTRGERIALDLPVDFNRLDTYESDALTAALNSQMEFQIHDIDEAESLHFFSASSTTQCVLLILVLVLYRLL